MKKLSLFALMTLVCLFAITAEAKDPTTTAHTPDGKVEFQLSEEKILISFEDGLSFTDKQAILSSERTIEQLKESDILPSPDVTIAKVSLSGEPWRPSGQTPINRSATPIHSLFMRMVHKGYRIGNR